MLSTRQALGEPPLAVLGHEIVVDEVRIILLHTAQFRRLARAQAFDRIQAPDSLQ
jgi:hypothetical protein